MSPGPRSTGVGPAPPVTYIVPKEITSPKFGAAFSAGCKGTVVSVQKGFQQGDVAAFGTPPTWPLFEKARALGLNWYYGDHAFYGRGQYFRIAKNARQYIPTPQALAAARPERFRHLGITVAPTWKTDGRHVVICPNSPIYMSQWGLDAADWATQIEQTIREHSGRPVIIRWKTEAAKRPLSVDLQHAWAVVVWNSASAIEALCAGVPIVTLCPEASTIAMGLSDLTKIESPYYPELRLPFLWDIANHQWTLPEIKAGVAWRTLNA